MSPQEQQDKKQQYAVCLRMVDALFEHDSWCGETHLQKASYVMQTLGVGSPLWDFVLYKHGPYSFDLHATIDDLRQMEFLVFKVQPPYGPQIRLSKTGQTLLRKYSSKIEHYNSAIDKTASLLAGKGVRQLEKIGTALLLMKKHPGETDDSIAMKLNEAKPHVSLQEALQAVEEVRELEWNFQEVCSA